MEFKVIKRRKAIALGLSKYYTGKPCLRGHVDERYSQGGGCVTCTRAFASFTRPKDTPEQRRRYHLNYIGKPGNKAKLLAYKRRYRRAKKTMESPL